MTPAKVAKGYAEISVEEGCPLFAPGSKIRGYINHSSELVQEQHIAGIPSTSQWSSSYKVTLKQCQPGCLFPNPIITDGFTSSRVIASYVHHQFARSKQAVEQIVETCKQVDISAVSSAVATSRRMADFLEGSIVHTPPPTVCSIFDAFHISKYDSANTCSCVLSAASWSSTRKYCSSSILTRAW